MAEGPLSRDLTLPEFVRFRDYINQHAGIYLEEAKIDSLRISLLTRATRLRMPSLDAYHNLLVNDEHEFKELLNLITINETSFFRFPQQFDALRDHVIPEVIQHKHDTSRNLRIWSAGCSTGEEPYSISMCLLDLRVQSTGWKPQVYGTDVSTEALATAQAGRYPSRSVLNLAPDVLQRHFSHASDGYRIKPHVRDIVSFGFHNLIKEPYPLALMGDWDVIFCRNVTIYFQMESTRRVIANFFRCLNPGGYLFVGHSETLTGLSDEFEPKEVGGVFLYHKPRRAHGLFGGMSLTERVREVQRSKERKSTRVAADPKIALRKRIAQPPAEPELDPASPEGRLETARKASALGEPRAALEALQPLLDDGASDTEIHLLAAYAHADLGDYDEALVLCDRALAANPLLPTARYVLGIIHQRRGDHVNAVSELKKTIYIDSDFALAHLNLGNIYKAQRRWDLAAREYENALKALRRDPEGEWTRFMGGFKADLLVKTVERSLIECQRAGGLA